MDTRLAYIVNLLFLLNTHFHVLRFSSKRTSTFCGRTAGAPAPLTPCARCACRALSPELDCSGRCLAKRLHEPCVHEHCTNSTPVKLLITRSIKHNNVRSLSDLTRILLNTNSVTLLKAAFLSVAFSLPPVPLCGSLPVRGRPGTSNTTSYYCATA